MKIRVNTRIAKIKNWAKPIAVLMLGLVVCTACQKEKKEVHVEADLLHESMQKLSDIIVHDIFSPPVAARIYSYPSIAAYEILASQDSSYRMLAGQLNGLTPIPEAKNEVNHEVAAVQVFQILGKKLIFSEDKMEAFTNEWHQQLKQEGIDEEVFQNSLAYADEVAAHILAWANEDNYKQTRTFEKFNVNTDDSTRWQPTPPAYIDAIEPHWDDIRPFVIDSSDQFIPIPPTPFNAQEGSPFYVEMKEVYETGVNLSDEQEEIARFWDCNPYVMNVNGHVMFATKKITPGGHWIGIVKIASKKAKADLIKTAQAYALTSITLNDGFISCWDEKYRSNLIRPETVINRYLDEEWQPLLQTPPFPEYTSGHSVISSAAAITLTSIYGEPFHMVDSTEAKYGLPPREFNSFIQASEEAAISRLYGGIHYMPAITEGVKQGRQLGRFIVNNIEMDKKNKFDLANSEALATSKYQGK